MNDVSLFTVVAASLVAAATDLWCYRIYNLLTLPLLLSGLAFGLLNSGWWGLAESAAGAGIGFGALIGLYLMGGMGAGDVKLMAGLGAWLGPAMISDVLLASCLAAGLYGIGLLVCNRLRSGFGREPSRRGLRERWRAVGDGDELAQLAESPARRQQLIPFGLVILVGLLGSLARAHGHL